MLNSNYILRLTIVLSIILVIVIYFFYRPNSWPWGAEAAGCLIALIMLSATAFLLWKLRKKFINYLQKRNVAIGFIFGLLWTIEIIINYFIRPGPGLRGDIDNILFSLIAILIFINAARDAYLTNTMADGMKSGFWSGISSGAIACITGLALIVFGMKYILLDPINIKQWADVGANTRFPGIEVYFAYQTFSGAIMHLFILGAFMGLILGSIGGLTGKILNIIKSLNAIK